MDNSQLDAVDSTECWGWCYEAGGGYPPGISTHLFDVRVSLLRCPKIVHIGSWSSSKYIIATDGEYKLEEENSGRQKW
jgi:hypothetical protein